MFFSSKKYLALVALAVVVRPTALIVWFPLLMYHFWQEQNKLRLITHTYIPIGFVPLSHINLINLRLLFPTKNPFFSFQDIGCCDFHSDRLSVL